MMLTTSPVTCGSRRGTWLDLLPGAGLLLLEAEGDLLLVVVDVEDLDLDLLVDADHLRGVVDPAPGHVGDVQQAVDAAEVDEGAEVGDVLDRALDDVALVEVLEEALACGRRARFDELAAGDDDVAALGVDLEDLRADGAADELADVVGTADVDLAGGQEDRHADIDEQAALDLPHAGALDGVAFGLVVSMMRCQAICGRPCAWRAG
jgi:hypothetical protein